jgi:hypothetical protein
MNPQYLNDGTNIAPYMYIRTAPDKVRIELPCGRCGGSGNFSFCPAYGTTCFECTGKGTVVRDRKVYTAKQIAAKATAKQRKIDAELARREAAAQAKADAWTSCLETDTELAEAYKCDHKIVANIKDKHRQWGSISGAQRNLVLKLAADAVANADIPPVEEGRRTVEGTVLSVKESDGPFGSTIKVRVQEASGAVVYCTVPHSIDAAVDNVYDLKGKVIRFDARVKRSDTDPSFGFGTRPTNGWIIE